VSAVAQPLGSISVDLDSLHHYCRIHGLPESTLDDRARALVYEVAVPRFLALFERLGLTGTFFAIGEDLAQPGAGAALRAARAAGVEVGNHSHSHDYALSRRSPQDIDRELARGEEAIGQAVGERPTGFRAPGYTLSAPLYEALCRRGYLYDSSTFPAVPYYAAKAAVMGALALWGRPSRAVLDTPRVLAAPRRPYHPDPQAPYRRGTGEVLELPISCAPWTRLPFIGTFAVALPLPVVRTAYLALRADPLVNFELHAVDVLSFEDGIPEALVARQRDLRVRVADKLARLETVFGWLADDCRVLTLQEAARALR
jgi:peptidoglycan/xylan/chitin deacetylase (PgdA/CDA1 family)